MTGAVTGEGVGLLSGVDVTATTAPVTEDSEWYSSTSRRDGTYVLAVPVGEYELCFEEESWDAPSRFGVVCRPLSVGADGATSVDVELPRLPTVSGVVTGEGGVGIPAEVSAESLPGDEHVYVYDYTRASGAYRLPVPAGAYRICFSGDEGTHCRIVEVTSAGVTGLDIAFASLPKISGRVVDSRGRPAHTEVRAYAADATAEVDPLASVETDNEGNYALPTGTGDFKLCFEDNMGATAEVVGECWEDASIEAATAVTVTDSGQAGLDAALDPPSVLRGKVSVAGGGVADHEGLLVHAFAKDAFGYYDDNYSAEVNPDGSYALTVPPGDYAVRFRGVYDSPLPVNWKFWTSQGMVSDLSDAEPVTVGRRLVSENIDGRVARRSGIGGRLTGILPGGQGVDVIAHPSGYEDDPWGVDSTELYLEGGAVSTRRWALELYPGSYRVEYRFEDGTSTWYGGDTAQTASDIEVVKGALTGGADLTVGTSLAHYEPGVPRVTGDGALGSTLTAQPGTWPADTDVTYRWPDGSSASTFVVRKRDVELGSAVVTVKVTGTTPGYEPVTRVVTFAGSPATRQIANTAPPTISDLTPEVGQSVTVTEGSWSETGVAYSYQWTAGGVDIAGATGSTYSVTAAEVGKKLRARVTASKTGFAPLSVTSAPTAAVAPGTIDAETPLVTGRPKVGRVLSAQAGASVPSEVTVTYQWLRDGAAVPGATGSSYTLTQQDQGTRINVKVTRSAPGYNKLVLKSARTRIIQA